MLSAAWSLYAALYPPSQLLIPDRVVHLLAAREAICSPAVGTRGNARTRWEAVARHLNIYERLAADGSGAADPKLVEQRVSMLRHLTVHAGDTFALATGAPIDSTRNKNIPRGQLVHAIAWSDAGLAAAAIGRVAAKLMLAADAAGYDEGSYESYFAPVTNQQ